MVECYSISDDRTITCVLKNPKYISDELLAFYHHSSEENRLENGLGPFEFERVKFLINKYINNPASIILDVGGGTGKYAFWLASQGHNVHLVDPIPLHVELATKRAQMKGSHFTAEWGYAQELNFPDGKADLVILHGPLYHLSEKGERRRAIAEARRVLKPGGVVLGFGINYSASTLVGLYNGLIHNTDFLNICKEELQWGTHTPQDAFPWILADSFYHRPSQLKSEFEHAEFSFINTHAVEGMVWMAKDFMSAIHLPRKKKQLLELLDLTDSDPELLAMSPHIMIAVKKAEHESD